MADYRESGNVESDGRPVDEHDAERDARHARTVQGHGEEVDVFAKDETPKGDDAA